MFLFYTQVVMGFTLIDFIEKEQWKENQFDMIVWKYPVCFGGNTMYMLGQIHNVNRNIKSMY